MFIGNYGRQHHHQSCMYILEIGHHNELFALGTAIGTGLLRKLIQQSSGAALFLFHASEFNKGWFCCRAL